jgi:hypothetical protein
MILNSENNLFRELDISTHIQQLPTGVILPPNMPFERMTAYRTTVANRLREGVAKGQSEAAIITRVADEQRAIAQAIAVPAFSASMASAYAQELAQLNNPTPIEEAKREVDSILRNRIEDCKNFVWLLGQADFMASTREEMAKPAAPKGEYQLSARKIEEEIANLVTKADGGAQPAVHVGMSLRGHQVGHQALANIFRPKAGQLRAPLVDALTTVWPNATGEEIHDLAVRWLKARHDPAHAIADATKVGGAIYTGAMARAEQKQHEVLKLELPAPALAEKPATTTIAPREAQGKLASADLAMDVL